MKCFVLAGGTGDRLWPISRKNYPKQFTELHEGRSLFQETIVRNMPLCDEFYIFINEKHLNIVKGQLQSFQNINYKLFVETKQLKTALPILIAALGCKSDEMILIVSADGIIGDGNYNESVTEAKKVASDGFLALVTVPADEVKKEYKYLLCEGKNIISFVENAESITDIENGKYMYDIGISVNRNDVLLKQFREKSPEMFYKTVEILRRKKYFGNQVILDYRDYADVPKVSLGKALSLNPECAQAVSAAFRWDCCFSLETLAADNINLNTIINHSENVSVINNDKNRIVVLNRMKDTVVVNTKNAVYISAKDHSSDIKQIIKQYCHEYSYFFDESEIYYQPWGIKENLSTGNGYRITKMTVFPGKFLQAHSHATRSEHWSVVSGSANIKIGSSCREYKMGESAFAGNGVFHQVGNTTDKVTVLIETALAPEFVGFTVDEELTYEEPFYPLEPSFKDYLWGGNKIRDCFGKKSPLPVIAESWEISAHPAGQSIVKFGENKGLSLGLLLSKLGKECLGWKSQAFDRFPLLVKFIDAQDILSIQVHPYDDYSLMVENEYGKNEMWYVMDCADDAYIYYGFNKDVGAEEIRHRIKDDTLTEVLNKVPVKKGEVYFIEAGTVHAIGPGILICEIQQNSNATYRLYDFGRKDKDGNARALHIDKALDVLDFSKKTVNSMPLGTEISEIGYKKQLLCECKYFKAEKYTFDGNGTIYLDSSSFAGFVIIEGSGSINAAGKTEEFKKGDSFFFPAQKLSVHVDGNCELIKIGL